MKKPKRTHALDLNNPRDARMYLAALEYGGNLVLEDFDGEEITDEEAVLVAGMVFVKLNGSEGALQ